MELTANEQVDALEEPTEMNQDDHEQEPMDEEPPEINPSQSLFDNHISSTLEANLAYMTNTYSFFLPDPEYLIDLEGLLGYCSEKIRLGHTCLYCQRIFTSYEGCMKHMRDKRHCKILYERGVDQEEYDVFATSLSAASSANVTAGSYFRNEADTADIAVSASVTSGFSKMKVMLSANIHNPINTSTEAVVRLERSVNGGAGTTVKRFIFPAGSNYYGGVEFMFVDDHGQVPGSLIEYKLVNDMSNGYSGEDLRMWYGISGDTFGLKEIV